MSEFLSDLHAEEISHDDINDTYEPDFSTGPRVVPPMDEPDPVPEGFVKPKTQTPRAKKYQRKIQNAVNVAIRATAGNPNTSADAAALVMYGPDLSTALADAADANPQVARMVDFLTDTTDSPYTALFAVAVPLTLQLIRNHEPIAEATDAAGNARRIAIPFTNRSIGVRFNVKLGRVRAATNDPKALWRRVFGNKSVTDALAAQGVTAVPPK